MSDLKLIQFPEPKLSFEEQMLKDMRDYEEISLKLIQETFELERRRHKLALLTFRISIMTWILIIAIPFLIKIFGK